MKVIVEYNKSDGAIIDKQGHTVAWVPDLQHFGIYEESSESRNIPDKPSIGEMVKLKESGLTVDEIIQLSKNGLL